MPKSAEQQARDLLEQCGVEDAQSFTAGDVVALANFIADAEHLRAGKETLLRINAPTAPELYGLVDRWMDESTVARAMGDSEDTADTLRECAEELAALLPPRRPPTLVNGLEGTGR